MTVINAIPNEILTIIIEFYIQQAHIWKFQDPDSPIPVKVKFNYPSHFSSHKWHEIEQSLVLPLRQVCKKFQFAVDSIIFKNVSYEFPFMYAGLFDYEYDVDQYPESLSVLAPRKGPSFELSGNIFPRSLMYSWHVPFTNNSFSNRYSDIDLVGKTNLSRQLYLSLSDKQAQLLDSSRSFKNRVDHLFIEIVRSVDNTFYAVPSLSEVGVDVYSHLKQITINLHDDHFEPYLIEYMKRHSFTQCLHQHVSTNGTIFHLNLRLHYVGAVLEYLDLKNSTASICLDYFDDAFIEGLDMEVVAKYCKNVKDVVCGELSKPIDNIEQICNLTSLESIYINESIETLSLIDKMTDIKFPPTLKRLSIDFGRFLVTALKFKTPLTALTHLNIIISEPEYEVAGYLDEVLTVLFPQRDLMFLSSSVSSSHFSLPNLESFELTTTLDFEDASVEDCMLLSRTLGLILTANKIKQVTLSVRSFQVVLESVIDTLFSVEKLTLVTIFTSSYECQTDTLKFLFDDFLPNLEQLTLQYFTEFNIKTLFNFIGSPKTFFLRFPSLEFIEGLYFNLEKSIEHAADLKKFSQLVLDEIEADLNEIILEKNYQFSAKKFLETLEVVVYDNKLQKKFTVNGHGNRTDPSTPFYPTCFRINLLKARKLFFDLA